MISLDQIKIYIKYPTTHGAPKEELQLLSDEQWLRLNMFQHSLWVLKNKPEICPPEFEGIVKQMMRNECPDESTYQFLLDGLQKLNTSWISRIATRISGSFSIIKKLFRKSTLESIS